MAQQALPYTLPDIPNSEAWKRTGEMFTDLYSLQSQILSAGDSRFANPLFYPTIESKIDAMLTQCEVELKTIGAIPATMIPHNPALIGAHPTVRRVREGGDYSVYDVQAYGADPLGVIDAGPSWNACRAAMPVTGGPMRVSYGAYKLTTPFTFNAQSNITVIIDPGVALTGAALPAPAVGTDNTYIDYRDGFKYTGVAPFWVVRDNEGLTNAHMSNPHYILVGEAEDAVIGLFSAREGDHGSGIDLAEMQPAGTLLDKWFIGKSSSAPSGGQLGSTIRWEYGTNADYSLNAKVFEFTPFGGLWMGSVTVNATRTRGVSVATTVTGGTSLSGGYFTPLGETDGTGELRGLVAEPRTTAAAYTVASVMGIRVNNAIKGAGSTISAQYGIYIDNLSSGASPFNYAIFTNTGLVRFGDRVTTVASASGGAKFNVPHGAAPSSPVDGDIWTTTSGLFVRVNGSTVGPLT